jgi:hypothetical protein
LLLGGLFDEGGSNGGRDPPDRRAHGFLDAGALVTVTSGAMVLTWSAAPRLLELRFEQDSPATRQHGVVLVDLLTRSLGDDGRPFALLCDGARVTGLDVEYRAVTSKFFRQHRERCLIAAYNLGPIVRIIAEMFRIGTGTRVQGFAQEAEARAWLRRNGIAA